MNIATGRNKVNRTATTKPKVQESSASQGKVVQEPVKGTDKTKGSYSIFRGLTSLEETTRYDKYWYNLGLYKAKKARDAKWRKLRLGVILKRMISPLY